METKPGYIKYRIRDLEKFRHTTGIATSKKYVWIRKEAQIGYSGSRLYDCYVDGSILNYGFDSDWFNLGLFDNVADKLDLI